MSEPFIAGAENGDPPTPNSPPKGGLPPTTTATRASPSACTSKSSPCNRDNNNSVPPLPRVVPPLISTPARDPAAMVAKRMQHLQLHGTTALNNANAMSPLPSNLISASSPMRTMTPQASTNGSRHHHHHQYDLTPIMKNTSEPPGMATGSMAGVGASVDLDNGTVELDFDLDKLTTADPSSINARCHNLVSPDNHHHDVAANLHATTSEGGLLQGEHLLALPEDLCKGPDLLFASRNTRSVVLPPMSNKRGILPVNHIQRRGSTGSEWTKNKNVIPSVLSSSTAATASSNNGGIMMMMEPPPCTSVIRAPELAFFPEESLLEDPIPFPPSSSGKKCNTFTSREQYEKQLQHNDNEEEQAAANNPKLQVLRPYQPSRQDRGIVDIPREALNSIFMVRRTTSGSTGGEERSDTDGTFSSTTGPTTTTTTSTTYSDDGDEYPPQQHQNQNHHHPGLFAAIPLEDRQWSIPSIRMANQLNGGGEGSSVATYTDDEDSLLSYRDDASLSSMGSYTNLLALDHANTVALGGDVPGTAAPFVVSMMTKTKTTTTTDHHKQQQQHSISLGGCGGSEQPFALLPGAFAARGEESITFDAEDDDDTDDDGIVVVQQPPPRTTTTRQATTTTTTTTKEETSRYHQHKRRQKRKEQRDRQAYEWLRTLKAGEDQVAEAASSKFLMGRSNHSHNHSNAIFGRRRLSSAAVETASFGFLAHSDSMDDRSESFHNILATH